MTFEPGAAFWGRRLHGELTQVDESLERDMYALAIDRLTAAGLEHYEVSNFARPGCRSRHNETTGATAIKPHRLPYRNRLIRPRIGHWGSLNCQSDGVG